MWGPMIKAYQLKKLQKLQNKCVHLIDTTRKNIQQKYKEFCLLKIQEIIDLDLSKIGYKLLKNKLLPKISDILKTDQKDLNLVKKH